MPDIMGQRCVHYTERHNGTRVLYVSNLWVCDCVPYLSRFTAISTGDATHVTSCLFFWVALPSALEDGVCSSRNKISYFCCMGKSA